MVNGKKGKGGKKAIKDLEPKDVRAADVKGGVDYLKYKLDKVYVTSYSL